MININGIQSHLEMRLKKDCIILILSQLPPIFNNILNYSLNILFNLIHCLKFTDVKKEGIDPLLTLSKSLMGIQDLAV